MENFLTITPPTSKDGAALCAATLQQRGIILSPAEQAALAAAQQTDLIIVLKPDLAHKRTSFVQSFRCGSAARGVFLL